MRLFIAINFTSEFKNILLDDIGSFKKYCLSANYTKKENLHLTLAFIGETNDASRIKKAMDVTEFESFEIGMGEIGSFRDLYFRKILHSPQLSQLQKKLIDNLERIGVDFDKKNFKPHITLARKVELISKPILPDRDKKMAVEKISLMKSERINGRLTYTEIYSKNCN